MKPTEKQKTIAEEEAERRHEAEMKSILKVRLKDINELSQKINEILDEILDERHKAERLSAND